jgi:hypothetical protein
LVAVMMMMMMDDVTLKIQKFLCEGEKYCQQAGPARHLVNFEISKYVFILLKFEILTLFIPHRARREHQYHIHDDPSTKHNCDLSLIIVDCYTLRRFIGDFASLEEHPHSG